ncbi:MAG: terminase family protein [Spirochaetes bacterium]|nr:terminase family protein [Spirochaetota bacterium]
MIKMDYSSILDENLPAYIQDVCGQDLAMFGRYVDPIFRAKFPLGTKHVEIITRHLEGVERGAIKRLFVAMPPRHGKSYTVSRLFTPWLFGRNPARNIILASYGADLAEDFSRYQLNLMETAEYKHVFQTRLNKSARSQQRYQTDAGGMLVACGVGGPIYGRGADIGIIDDPIKNWEVARSEAQLEHLWEWYQGFITRLHKGGAVVLCMHRWGTRDLAARIMERDQEYGDWTVLELPALADPTEDKPDPCGRKAGEALWPTEYSSEALARTKREVDARIWAAQYQQRPTDQISRIFPEPIYAEPPEGLKVIAYFDPAYSEESSGDYSALTIGGEHEGLIYIVGGFVWKKIVDEAYYEKIETLCKTYTVQSLTVETNKDEGAIAHELRRRKLYVREKKATTNKFLRITDLVLKNWDKIRFSSNVTGAYLQQVLDYNELARHDDAPDSLAGIIERYVVNKTPGVILKSDYKETIQEQRRINPLPSDPDFFNQKLNEIKKRFPSVIMGNGK